MTDGILLISISARSAHFNRMDMMKISEAEVDYVAILGRLALKPDEKKKYRAQLDDILNYMDKLGEVPTDDVEPMAGPVELYTPLREDAVRPSLSVDEALANAPAQTNGSFRVPKIIE